jgi:YbbR domain-containing protein
MRLQWLTSNSGLKVVSLVLATATWFFVKSVTSERRLIDDVPLEFKVRSGLKVASASPGTVSVVLRGTHSDIWQVPRAELVAVLNLTHQESPGEYDAPLSLNSVRHPPRVQVVQVLPAAAKVRLVEARPVDTPDNTGVQGRP